MFTYVIFNNFIFLLLKNQPAERTKFYLCSISMISLMRKTDLLFLLAIVFMGFLYGLHRIIPIRPYSIHQWRQTDCLSITLNYSNENLPFTQPAIHKISFGEEKVISAFPIKYFIIRKL